MWRLRVAPVETSASLAFQASPAHQNRTDLVRCLVLSLGRSDSFEGWDTGTYLARVL